MSDNKKYQFVYSDKFSMYPSVNIFDCEFPMVWKTFDEDHTNGGKIAIMGLTQDDTERTFITFFEKGAILKGHRHSDATQTIEVINKNGILIDTVTGKKADHLNPLFIGDTEPHQIRAETDCYLIVYFERV